MLRKKEVKGFLFIHNFIVSIEKYDNYKKILQVNLASLQDKRAAYKTIKFLSYLVKTNI